MTKVYKVAIVNKYKGAYSDVSTFEVKKYQQVADEDNYIDDRIKICWTTDQQAWTVEEAQATSVVFQNITEWEKDTGFDFHLNTGDISQNKIVFPYTVMYIE